MLSKLKSLFSPKPEKRYYKSVLECAGHKLEEALKNVEEAQRCIAQATSSSPHLNLPKCFVSNYFKSREFKLLESLLSETRSITDLACANFKKKHSEFICGSWKPQCSKLSEEVAEEVAEEASNAE